MQRLAHMLQQSGGAILAVGILALGISGLRPGWGAISRLFPDPAIITTLGTGLAAVGLLLLGLGRMVKARQSKAALEAALRTVQVHPDGTMTLPPAGSAKPRAPLPPLGPQERLCLKPAWPQRPTSHWIGGLPHLPDATPWPMIDGRPACFLAQIALDDLPASLWRGTGPRRGWLVLFGAADSAPGAAVLHVEGKVAPRSQPDGVSYQWHLGIEVEGMQRLIGDAARVPPRWFLDFDEPGRLGSVEDRMQSTDGEPDHWDGTRGGWVWEQPHPLSRHSVTTGLRHSRLRNVAGWDTAFAILASLETALQDLDRNARVAIRMHAPQLDRSRARVAELTAMAAAEGAAAEKARKELPSQQAVPDRLLAQHRNDLAAVRLIADQLAQVQALTDEIRAAAGQGTYSSDVGDSLFDLVQTFESELKEAARKSLTGFDTVFAGVMEHLARRAYTQDPARLAPELLAHYGPLWQQECAEARIYIGTNAEITRTSLDPQRGQSWLARLLDMPTIPLTGVAFGDLSRFYIDIPAEDLAAGDFRTARGTSTHGNL